ncbi:hypothetical protein SDC9_110343 [bioreactor metagenome]|uniref:CUB domain-containing protein n=1 Tax=bioreactor metagenome TaxID=1076179 RepID=A0A645BJR5_9ZZZZ
MLTLLGFSAFGQEDVRQKVKSGTNNSSAEARIPEQQKTEQSQKNAVSEAEAFRFKMSDGSVQTCFGEFFDSGGPTGSYSVDENSTYTIESGTEGAYLILRFVEFFLSEGDELTVYDGGSAAAKVIGTFSKSNPIPFEIRSTGGTLTFVFTSDSEGNGSGWRASIACYVGSRKVLKTDGTVPSTRLIYHVGGLKTDSDFRLIEDMLKANEYVLNCEYDKENSYITVTVSDESFKDVILEQISSSKSSLGYDISVKLREIIPAK